MKLLRLRLIEASRRSWRSWMKIEERIKEFKLKHEWINKNSDIKIIKSN